MRIREVLLTAAAGLMAVSPVAASASGVTGVPSRVGVERVGTPVKSSEQFGGGSSWLLIALAAVAVGVGIFLIVDNNDDQPASP